MNKLQSARNRIDEIDKQMAKLFEERMNAVKAVAEYKIEKGMPVLDSSREQQVIEKNCEYIDGEDVKGYYKIFMKDTMSVSKLLQKKIMSGMKIAYSGVEGAFAHIAAERIFPNSEKIAFGDFASAYKAVENGECDSAVLPLENSYAGEVGQVMDLSFKGSLFVNGVFDFAINQNLIGIKGAKTSEITQVISHPQALMQCAGYIKEHGYKQTEYANTALAAKYVKELNDKNVATIASYETAAIYGLEVIEAKINEDRTNTTRFAVFSRTEERRNGGNKYFIIEFTVKHCAGALAEAVNVIGKYGFNMRVLRSRPMKELAWSYYFYVESEGDIHSETGEAMTAELQKFCDKFKIIGSYKNTGEVFD